MNIKNLIASLRKWLWARLFKPVRQTMAPARNYPKNFEDDGAFYYLKDILDRLPQCQKMLKRIKKIDPDAYEYHRRVGARVLPHSTILNYREISPLFLKNLPAIGMTYVYSGSLGKGRDGKDRIPASFNYFQKISKRGVGEEGLILTGNDLYKMIVIHDDGKLTGGGAAYFDIPSNGIPRVLKKKASRTQSFRTRKRGTKIVTIHHNTVDYPQHLRDLHQDNLLEKTVSNEFDEYASQLFILNVNEFCTPASENELQVRCERAGIVAMFNVCTKRTPYFFADRHTTLAVDGKRKRIFHIVRAHTRVLKNGKISDVMEHYRGERRFSWGGHKVIITVPKLHHLSLNSFGAPAYETDHDETKEWIGSDKLGAYMSDMMNK